METRQAGICIGPIVPEQLVPRDWGYNYISMGTVLDIDHARTATNTEPR